METLFFKEIWKEINFLQETKIRLNQLSENAYHSLELVKAIHTFRQYPILGDLMKDHPEYKPIIEPCRILWRHFNALSCEDLAELAIQSIHEAI